MLLENWKRNPCIIYYVKKKKKKDDVLFAKIEVDVRVLWDFFLKNVRRSCIFFSENFQFVFENDFR